MTWKPKGELQAETNRSTVFAAYLLPTALPADIGKLLELGIAELNQRTAFCRSGKIRVEVLRSGSTAAAHMTPNCSQSSHFLTVRSI